MAKMKWRYLLSFAAFLCINSHLSGAEKGDWTASSALYRRMIHEDEFIESLESPQDRRKGWLWLIKHQDDIYKHFVQEWVTNSEAKAFSNLLNSFRNINLLFENVYRGYSSMSKEESKEIAELYEYAKSSERAVLYLDLLSFILGDNSKRSVIIEILETRHADQDWVLRSRSLMALYVRKDKSFIPYAFKMLKDDTRFETLSTITYKKCWRYPARNAAESFMRALGYSIDFIDGELQAVRVPTRRIKHLFGVEAKEIDGHPPIPPEPGGEAEE